MPSERQIRAAASKSERLATQNANNAKRQARRVEAARKRLTRVGGLTKGIRVRLTAGLSVEEIARDISEQGDAILTWHAWIRGPVATALEAVDGPTLYAAALLVVTAARDALVKADLLQA